MGSFSIIEGILIGIGVIISSIIYYMIIGKKAAKRETLDFRELIVPELEFMKYSFVESEVSNRGPFSFIRISVGEPQFNIGGVQIFNTQYNYRKVKFKNQTGVECLVWAEIVTRNIGRPSIKFKPDLYTFKKIV